MRQNLQEKKQLKIFSVGMLNGLDGLDGLEFARKVGLTLLTIDRLLQRLVSFL